MLILVKAQELSASDSVGTLEVASLWGTNVLSGCRLQFGALILGGIPQKWARAAQRVVSGISQTCGAAKQCTLDVHSAKGHRGTKDQEEF